MMKKSPFTSTKILEHIGPYKIISELSSGGMGKVYKAYDPQASRVVAIKMVLSPSSKARQRFFSEAKAMAKLRHPNIVTIYNIATDPGTNLDYIAMDFIEGQDLSKKELLSRQALTIIRDVALALDYAHQQGIIHRDLKPANIVLSKDNKPIVVDFGLAKDVAGKDITEAGALMGTPHYMAPEQAASLRESICPQTDVYALGVILYKLLSGVYAIEGDTPAQIIYNILHQDPVPLQHYNPRIAKELDFICSKAMAKEIGHRYSSAKALADDLSRFLKGEIVHVQSFPLWYQAKKLLKKHKAIVIVIAVFVLTLASSIWISYIEQHKKNMAHLHKAKKILAKLPKKVMLIDVLEDAKKFTYGKNIDAILSSYVQALEALKKVQSYEKTHKLLLQIYRQIGLLALTKKNYILSQNAFNNYYKLSGSNELLQLLGQQESLDLKHLEAIMAKLKKGYRLSPRQMEVWEVIISRMQHPKIVQKLLPYIESPYGWQRLLTIRVLGKLGDKFTSVNGKNSEDWLLKRLGKLHPIKDIDLNDNNKKINREIEELILALGRLKSSKAEKLVNQKRQQAGQNSLLWMRTKLLYKRIPLLKGKLNSSEAYNERGLARNEKGNFIGAIADYTQAIALDPRYSEAYNNRGNAYRKLKEYQKAIADYIQAIALSPGHPMVYSNRGNAYNNLKQYHKAIADYAQAISLNPRHSQAYNNRGVTYSHLKEYQKAIADFTQAIALNPGYSKAYNHRGIAYSDLKEYQKAIADYTQAISLNPGYSEAYNNRGNVYINLKQYHKAITDFTKTIALNPRYSKAYNNRANVYSSLKEYQKAIADYTQAISLNPKFSGVYLNRGMVYRGLKKNQRAIVDFNRAIAINPKFSEAYINRGIAYHNLKKYQRAIADYTQAISLNPRFPLAYTNRGDTYSALKEYQKAIVDHTQAIALNPNHSKVYSHRGRVYYYLKQYQKAIVDYTQAITLNSQSLEAHINRGLSYYHLKKYQRAIVDFTRAVALNPKVPLIYTSRGNVYYNLQQYQKAIVDYTQSIALDFKNAQPHYNRGNVYYSLKQYQKAIVDYTQAITLNPKYLLAYYYRGVALSQIRQHQKAILDFHMYLRLFPNAPQASQLRSYIRHHSK